MWNKSGKIFGKSVNKKINSFYSHFLKNYSDISFTEKNKKNLLIVRFFLFIPSIHSLIITIIY